MIGTSLLFSGSIAGLLTPFDSVAPTAGYSLRNLGLSYSGAVVRVRKDITGNPEQDFTASQITNGTLSNFLETLGTDAHSQSVSTQFEDLSDVSLICDCNSGGTDELDAFDALYENGFVSKWYDQFGSNDATQTTATDQPKIWDSTTGLLTEGGRPAIEFDGVDDSLATPDYIVELSQNNATVLSVTKADDSAYILVEADVASPYSSNFILGDSDGGSILWVNTTEFGAQPPTTQALLGFTYNGTNFQAYLNGSTSGSAGTALVNTEVLNKTVIGSRAEQSNNFYTGLIQEIITYKSDQTSNLTAIQNNINDYYDIY